VNQPRYSYATRATVPTSQPTSVTRLTCTEEARPRRKSALQGYEYLDRPIQDLHKYLVGPKPE
jgi:hypothetical protein